MVKTKLTIEELELMTQSKHMGSIEISRMVHELFGDENEHTLTFDIFDGFAYCHDYNGEEYYLEYPVKSLIDDANNMQKTIRETLNLNDDKELTILDIIATYSTLKKNI